VIRRRRAHGCGRRFTTYERVDEILPMVIEGRPPSTAGQIWAAQEASSKRPVPVEVLERAADQIERELEEGGEKEIPSSRIGDAVMAALRDIDEVAYVRFASVYRSFRDVNELMSELKSLVEARGRR
jgi:transcriptional repressor NrdR